MKRFSKRIVLLIFILLILEVLFGVFSKTILINEPDAGTNHSNFKQSLFDKEADIVILGASKANHHFITDSLAKFFGLSTYNCGVDGDNVLASKIQFESLVNRHQPKLVILDLTGGQTSGKWKSLLLSHKSYYGLNDSYTEMCNELLDTKARISIKSSFYRMNGAFLDLIESYVKGDKNQTGYIPLLGSSPHLTVRYKNNLDDLDPSYVSNFRIDEVQENCMNYIVNYCKTHNIPIYITYSPSLIIYTNGLTDKYDEYCQEHNVTFLNWEGDTNYINHPEYFKDFNHLNEKGSIIFTRDFINKIKEFGYE